MQYVQEKNVSLDIQTYKRSPSKPTLSDNLSQHSILHCTSYTTFCPESLSCWKICNFRAHSRMLFVSRAMRAAQRLASLLRLTTAEAWSAVTLFTVSLSQGSKSYWMCCLSTGQNKYTHCKLYSRVSCNKHTTQMRHSQAILHTVRSPEEMDLLYRAV